MIKLDEAHQNEFITIHDPERKERAKQICMEGVVAIEKVFCNEDLRLIHDAVKVQAQELYANAAAEHKDHDISRVQSIINYAIAVRVLELSKTEEQRKLH